MPVFGEFDLLDSFHLSCRFIWTDLITANRFRFMRTWIWICQCTADHANCSKQHHKSHNHKETTKHGINLIREHNSLHFSNVFGRFQYFISCNCIRETVGLCQETNFWIFMEDFLPTCRHRGNEKENGRNNSHPHIFLFLHFKQNNGAEYKRHRCQNLVTNTKQRPQAVNPTERIYHTLINEEAPACNCNCGTQQVTKEIM